MEMYNESVNKKQIIPSFVFGCVYWNNLFMCKAYLSRLNKYLTKLFGLYLASITNLYGK